MRNDRARRLQQLESNVDRLKSGSTDTGRFITWLTDQHQHHVDWDLRQRIADAPFPERAAVIVDFWEAVEAKDPAAGESIRIRLERSCDA